MKGYWRQIFCPLLWFVLGLGTFGQSLSVAAEDDKQQKSLDELYSMTLEELFVIEVSSATKTNVKLAQAPAVISLISREDFHNYQYQSVAEALQSLPGLDVLYDLTHYNVGIRGINGGLGAQSQVLKPMIDGQDMAFRPTTGSFLGPEFIPSIAIDKVEVIRGPLSALYGADAFLGTVNVVPMTAEKMSVYQGNSLLTVSAIDTFGNFGQQTQLALWGTPNGFDIFAAISYQSLDRDGLSLPVSSPRFESIQAQRSITTSNDHDKNASLYLRINYDAKALGNFTFDLNHQYIDRSGNFQPDSEPLLGARVVLENTMARLRYQQDVSNAWSIRTSFSLNIGKPSEKTRQYDPFRIGADYLRRDYNFRQFLSSMETHWKYSEDINFVFGADYRFEFETLPTLILANTDGSLEEFNANRYIEVDNIGLFAQIFWSLSERLDGIAGLRVDSHSLYDKQHNYRLGLVYQYSEETTFKWLVGSSFKAPPLLLMFGGEHPRLIGPISNPLLKPQKALTTELNLGTRFLNYLHASLTLYQTKVTDFAEYDTISASPQAKNRGEIKAKGVELELRARFKEPHMDIFANYSVVDTELSSDIPVGVQVSDQSRLFAHNKFSIGINYTQFEWHMRFFALVHFIGERGADKSNLPFLPFGEQQEYFLPSYQLWNFGISSVNVKLFGDSESQFSLTLKNAFEKNYVEPGFSGIDVPGMQRQIILTYQQAF